MVDQCLVRISPKIVKPVFVHAYFNLLREQEVGHECVTITGNLYTGRSKVGYLHSKFMKNNREAHSIREQNEKRDHLRYYIYFFNHSRGGFPVISVIHEFYCEKLIYILSF